MNKTFLTFSTNSYDILNAVLFIFQLFSKSLLCDCLLYHLSFIDGHLGYFYIFAIINNVSTNIYLFKLVFYISLVK